MRDAPPRETLILALDGIPPVAGRAPVAVDLACGEGRDTVELLRRGFRVVAIDAQAEAIERLRTRVSAEGLDAAAAARLSTLVAPFEHAQWPACELLVASFAIPHTTPAGFARVWAHIVERLTPGGLFAGQLFGPDDTWARPDHHDGIDRVFHTRAQVTALIDAAGFEALHWDEVNRPGKTASGEPKHWHVHHLVLRRGPGRRSESPSPESPPPQPPNNR